MYSMAALYSLELGSEIPRLDIIAFVSADTAPEAALEVEADEDLVLLLLLVASLLAFNKEAAVSPLLRVLLERPPVPMEEVLFLEDEALTQNVLTSSKDTALIP